MTRRNRSQDLTDDLLHDLEAEDAAPAVAPTSTPARADASDDRGSAPSVEAAVYLAPRGWRRPSVSRAGRSLAVSAGPVRLRIGRQPA
jgi:hypothetical protein